MRIATISLVALVVCAGSVGVAWATGPAEQRVPWRPLGPGANQFSTLNSVVQISASGSLGSGTIISKNIDAATGEAWVCLLTAGHVVQGSNNITFRLGDNGAEGVFGGADSRYIIKGTDDLSVVGVRMGKVQGPGADPLLLAKFDALTPAGMLATNDPNDYINRQFSQVGYGGTGDFVAGGMNARVVDAGPLANPRYSLNIDNSKRFQNNKISQVRGVAGVAGNYFYDSIVFSFDPAAANGFLVGEGLSYAGDSGSPYFYSEQDVQAVGDMSRPGQVDWNGGDMPILTNLIMAVHTFGNSVPGGIGSNSFFSPYSNAAMGVDTFGGGIPLTQARVDWIETFCPFVPAPGGVAVMGVCGVFAMRRRRAG